MNKWVPEIHVWYYTNPTQDDVDAGRVKSLESKIMNERTISCWANEIKYLMFKTYQELDENGKIKNMIVYTIGIEGFKYTFQISSATYIQLQTLLQA